MKRNCVKFLVSGAMLIASAGLVGCCLSEQKHSDSVYCYSVLDNNGNTVNLDVYKGNVLLIVNTATQCGFTPQYEGLQALYAKYHNQGFEILDFPCNQFGEQAPGTDAEINEFCTLNFHTEFPRFKKIEVNGENREKLYEFLIQSTLKDSTQTNQNINWNFTKFLVDRNGQVIRRFESGVTCDELEPEIRKALE